MFGNKILFAIILGIAVFLEGSIPFWYADRKADSDHAFLGQVAYPMDQDMYFSFISQAKEGHWIFYNKLTYSPNKPVFINLEFLLVGFIQRVFRLSENAVYQTWRLIGASVLTLGFYVLAVLILPTIKQARVATAVFLFTGGFGFLFASLSGSHLIGADAAQSGTLDMRYGLLPFQQVLSNPHFSLAHGLILLAYALFLLAEKQNRIACYAASGVVFTVIGLVRPYDIIPPLVIFPIFMLISSRETESLRIRRLLPLLMIGPVFCYNVWLFKVNPIFSYWSRQGLNAGVMPGPLWHYLAYGVIGILAIWRMTQVTRNPLSNADRFLLVWFTLTFTIIQLGRYIPLLGWSPQLGVSLAAPLVLLGFSVTTDKLRKSKLLYGSAITGLVIVIAASNTAIVVWFVSNLKDKHRAAALYATKDEVRAWQWLDGHVKEKEVVLALPAASLRIAKYTPASVVAAHYSVSPRFEEMYRVIRETLMGLNSAMQLNQLNVDYVYIGPLEKRMKNIQITKDPYLKPVYTNPSVFIFRVSR